MIDCIQDKHTVHLLMAIFNAINLTCLSVFFIEELTGGGNLVVIFACIVAILPIITFGVNYGLWQYEQPSFFLYYSNEASLASSWRALLFIIASVIQLALGSAIAIVWLHKNTHVVFIMSIILASFMGIFQILLHTSVLCESKYASFVGSD
jgi:hypothetical protein